MKRNIGLILLIFTACAISGCTAPRGARVVTSSDPSLKIPAIKKVVRDNDLSAVTQLVKDLDSDDPAVRLYAIHGLEKLTGDRFGYQPYFDESQRKPSLERWNQWLKAQKK